MENGMIQCNKKNTNNTNEPRLPLDEMTDGIKGIIFDLDGTLIDSMSIWGRIDEEYTKSLGYDMPEDLRDDIEGMRFPEVAEYFKRRFLIKKSTDEIMQEWTDMAFSKYEHEVEMKPGARVFLQNAKRDGYKLGIATSNSQKLLDAVLKAQKIEHLFDAVCTGDMTKNSKPAPDVYLHVAQELGLLPSQCLVFEDIPQGIMSGKNAGMRVCAVEDDFSKECKLKKIELADFFIDTFEDII